MQKKGNIAQAGAITALVILVISIVVGGAIMSTLRTTGEITTQNNATRENQTVAGQSNATNLTQAVLFNVSVGGDREISNATGQIIVFQRNNRSQILTAGTHYFVLSLGSSGDRYAFSNAQINVSDVNWNVSENGMNITAEYNITERNSTLTKIASQGGDSLTNYSRLLPTAGIALIMIVIIGSIIAFRRDL